MVGGWAVNYGEFGWASGREIVCSVDEWVREPEFKQDVTWNC